MKKLTKEEYKEIRNWMYRNARPIELALWQYKFENGTKEAVLSALTFYQNEDGGFGHALEADSWNPNSSPYTTLQAINILKQMDHLDMEHSIILGIIQYLESNSFCSENGWYFSIPSNNDFPHAPWWSFNMETNEVEGIGVTAELVGFILLHVDKNTDLYKKALSLAEYLINKLLTIDQYGDMGIGGYCVLIESIKKAGLVAQFDCKLLTELLSRLVHDSIEQDMSKWSNYTVRPSEYITSSDSIFYQGNEEMVNKELDYLIETRPTNGVWNITWTWFELNDKYAKEFAISENWWKARKAIEKMDFLKSFKRLE